MRSFAGKSPSGGCAFSWSLFEPADNFAAAHLQKTGHTVNGPTRAGLGDSLLINCPRDTYSSFLTEDTLTYSNLKVDVQVILK